MSRLKLMTIVGTRPEIIRLAAVIKKCDKYFDQILVPDKTMIMNLTKSFSMTWDLERQTFIWMLWAKIWEKQSAISLPSHTA